MKVSELSSVTDECELAANAFSVNDIGLALMHTTKALMRSIKCSGNIGTLKELCLLSGNKVVGQSPNKMSAVAMALLYQANFYTKKGEILQAAETLFEICTLNNVDIGLLSIEDFETEEAINAAATNLIKSNSKLIIEAISNA